MGPVEEVGHPAAEVARFLGINRMGIQKAVIRGSELRRNQVSLRFNGFSQVPQLECTRTERKKKVLE